MNLMSIQVDEAAGTGKINLGLSVIVRVTLRDGTFHEVHHRPVEASSILIHAS